MNGRDGNNRRRRSGRRGQDRFGHSQDFTFNGGRENQDREAGKLDGKGEYTASKGGGPLPKGMVDTPSKDKFWKRKRDRSRPAASAPRYDKNGVLYERLHWTAPKLNTDPIPVSVCACCGKPITDLHAALTDKKTGEPVHFDCAISELAKYETLGDGDTISYIGGGRFGLVHFNNSGRGETGTFTIKKIFEWEDKENRAAWRGVIADHYSVT